MRRHGVLQQLIALVWLAVLSSVGPHAQAAGATAAGQKALSAPPQTGDQLFQSACVACHGLDGKGAPQSVVGFDVPLPDFTDCAFASAEPDPDWFAVIHEGGPVRGLDRHMPAFGSVLSAAEISLAIGHVRTFCTGAWPRGDLNLPRAFFTEKAFPENEAVWTTGVTTRPGTEFSNVFVYEQRLGARNQIEINAPIDFIEGADGQWARGLGDVGIAFKRAIHASAQSGRIVAAGVEVVFPTGKESLGLGGGDTVFEPFAMWGQVLPRNSFIQVHGGAELPAHPDRTSRELFLRSAVGTTFAQDRGFGRAWTPQLEVLWARPQDGSSEWDLVPQVQVTLSKLQHVMVAVGARVPLTQREERHPQALVYLLWDWFDGGFFDFWK
jgi:mono/diheme cytochrome c family protein